MYISTANDAVTMRIYDVRPFTGPMEANNYQEKCDALIKGIVEMVAPNGWRDAGGDTGELQIIGTRLAVKQTWQNQEAVERLLTDSMTNPNSTQPSGR